MSLRLINNNFISPLKVTFNVTLDHHGHGESTIQFVVKDNLPVENIVRVVCERQGVPLQVRYMSLMEIMLSLPYCILFGKLDLKTVTISPFVYGRINRYKRITLKYI